MTAKSHQLAFFPAALRDGNIDLHTHTTASDGSDTPSELYRAARANRLKVVGLTDHDTVAGITELSEAGIPLLQDVRPVDWAEWFAACEDTYVLPGVELSCEYDGTEVHLLGYFFKPIGEALHTFLTEQRLERERRNRSMIRRLRELDFPIPDDLLKADAGGKVKGRVAVALWLTENGHAESVSDAFDRYLLPGRPGYVARKRPSVTAAIRAVHQAGGITSLAHPQQYPCMTETVERDLARMAAAGLDAVEAFHTGSNPEQRLLYAKTARRLGLQMTAGSDYHGSNKDHHPLYVHTDYSVYFS